MLFSSVGMLLLPQFFPVPSLSDFSLPWWAFIL